MTKQGFQGLKKIVNLSILGTLARQSLPLHCRSMHFGQREAFKPFPSYNCSLPFIALFHHIFDLHIFLTREVIVSFLERNSIILKTFCG